MFGRRRGTWISFDRKDSNAKTVTFGTTCISTSAESAGHYRSIQGTGRIVGVDDRIKDAPQKPQAESELVQA
jgi:hypothetical protein